ncbi:MAG TPA: hypothetical protein VFM96_01000 [Gaiellaceae bacterium]|nr:hypothetical protein [Gaiellaceae bacterium]
MQVAVVIQARMSSERLPGKVLALLADKPALGYLLERLSRYRVVVATSTEPSDDAVADFCAERGTLCMRGPLQDVAGRFASVVATLGVDAFVRVSGDSPLLDPLLVEEGIALFEKLRPDLATNVFPRTFPKGQSVEVMDARTFLAIEPELTDASDREHVTTFFYARPERFRIENFAADVPAPDVNLAVDTPGDLERLDALVRALPDEYGWRELASSIGGRQ